MSTNLGPQLPPSVVELLSGEDLSSKVGTAFLLASPGEDGYPHPCIVTPGEVVALSPKVIHLALYGTSSATRNLRVRKAGTLALVLNGAAYYIKADAEERPAPAALDGLAVFTLTPKQVLEDKEPGAEVTSGLRFSDSRGEAVVLGQWLTVVGALKQLR